MPKARRYAVVALAVVFWIVALGTFVEALYISPALNPQPKEPDTLSSTVKFSFPVPIESPFPMSSVMVTYTIAGEAIVDNVPLTLDVLVKIPSSYMFVWTVAWVTIMPDNVVGIDVLPNGTIFDYYSNFFPLHRLSNMTTTGETWAWHSQILITSFGAFASTVQMVANPTEQILSLNPRLETIDFVVHNTTSILVESSRTVAAEKSAEWATQQEISLTWIIISLASLDVGFRVYDYSFYEKKNPEEDSYCIPD